MSIFVFLLTLTTLMVIYGFFTFIAARKITSITDYFLAGRNLGLAAVTFTLIATQLGGGMLLGTSQQAYAVGLYGILYTLGMSIGFLLLGCGIAGRLRALNVATTAEIFETKYNSVLLKKLASILSIATLTGILIGQVIASKTLLFGLGITNELLFLALWIFIIVHTMVGGLQAVVVTDKFQVLYIITIFCGLFLYFLFQEPASFFQLFSAQEQFGNNPLTFKMFISILFMPILFALIEQDLAQRFFAARTKKIAVGAALIASAFMLSFLIIPIFFGMKTKLLHLAMLAGANPLITFLDWFLPKSFVALATVGILAAIISTADSLLCAISSNASQDFDFTFTGITNKLTLSKIITLLIGIVALVASYFMPTDIIYILTESYAISVCCLFVPLIIAYFKKDCKKGAAIGAIAFGLVGFIFFQINPIALPHQIAALLLSALGYLIGSFMHH